MTREGYLKNKEIIKAWADGEEIEYYSDYDNIWIGCSNECNFNITSKYRLKPKVKEEEFTYPMWFKTILGTICRFDKLNYATCVDLTEESTWYVGEVISNCTPHTNKKVWIQTSEPKQTKIVYEWIVMPSTHNARYPKLSYQLLTEEEAKERFLGYKWYKKTGREFEVEV